MKHQLKYVFLALIVSFITSSSAFLAHNPSLYKKTIIKSLDDTNGNGTQSTHTSENPYAKVLAAETQQSSDSKQQSSEVAYDSSGENLVLNSSYEVNSGDEPKYWDITNGQQNQYSMVTDPVRSGDKSLKVTLNGKTIALYGKTSQDTASKAPYTLSVSLNLASYNCSGTKCTVTLGLTDSNTQNKLHTKAFTIDSTFPTNTWVRMSATFDNSQLTKLNPFIEFESDFSSGTVYLDDVKLEIGSRYTEYSQTNGLSASDGAISADKHGNLYPTKSNSGSLGTTNKKWLSLDLKSASIDKNGNLSVDGNAAIGGTADVSGDLHVIGKVGIGTTDPNSILDISGNVTGDTTAAGNLLRLTNTNTSNGARAGIVFQTDEGAGNRRAIIQGGEDRAGGTTGILTFLTRGSSGSIDERLRIDSVGNVGIGTTSPNAMLQIGSNTGTSNGEIILSRSSGASNRSFKVGLDSRYFFSVGDYANGEGPYTPFLTINYGSGNTGIGTSSPASKLSVLGNAAIGATYGNLRAPTSGLVVEGNVGIGTTNPTELLSTYGDFAGYSGSFFNDGNADTRQGLFIQGCLDTSPTSACNFLEFRDGNGTVLGAVEGNGAGGVTNASAGSDYAELFNGDKSKVERGDLLGIDANGKVVPATVNTRLLGVYSVKPATLGNWQDGWENDNGVVPVGLLGQLPVKVSTENGDITAGDFLTVSSKAGVAMKADKSGHTIGRALESTSSDGEILAYISTDYYTTDDLLKSASDDVRSSVKTLSEDYTKTFEKYDEELSQTKDDVKDIKKDIQSIWDLLEVLTLNDSNLKVKVNLNVDGDIAFKSATATGTIEAGIIKIDAKDGSIIAMEIKADKGTFDELTVKSLKIDSKDDDHKITGSGKLTAGEKSVTIDTKEAKSDSKIFITPTTKTNNQTLYVSDIKDGDGFEVTVEESQADDIKFNWWIIN